MIRVLLVDDTRLFLEALLGILEDDPEIGSVETAADPEAAALALATFRPDVVLVNSSMRALSHVLGALGPGKVPIVALGVADDEQEIIACAEAGVVGFLFCGSPLAELVPVTLGAARGETLCPPHVTTTLMRRVAALSTAAPGPPSLDRLTQREREVLGLLEQELSNKEIARRLTIEVRTVKNHVHNILEKMDVRHRGEAVARVRGSAIRRYPSPGPDPAPPRLVPAPSGVEHSG
jgi:two-component system nitrate/nitrite response regulator NarL